MCSDVELIEREIAGVRFCGYVVRFDELGGEWVVWSEFEESISDKTSIVREVAAYSQTLDGVLEFFSSQESIRIEPYL